MKKTFSIICMLLVSAILLTLPTFAAGVSKAPYEELGQDLYATGADYAPKAIAIDGVIGDEEGWVAVTPDGADLNVVTSTMAKAKSSKVLTIEHKYDSQLQNLPKVEYFVAQDNDYVYFAMKYSDNPTIYKFIKDDASNKNSFLTYVRLGFNANDYTEQLCLYTDGHYIAKDTAKGDYPKWTRYPLVMNGMADNSKFVAKTDDDTDLIEKIHLDSIMKEAKEGRCNVRTYEAKLSKAEITKLYKSTFGSADGVDFKTMFIGVSSSDYSWENGAPDVDFCVVHGTVLDEATATANGVNTFLPDMIYFGELSATESSAVVTEAPAGDVGGNSGDVEKPLDEGAATNEEPVVTTGSNGCGGAVSLAGIALLAALGTCTTFVAKKKED